MFKLPVLKSSGSRCRRQFSLSRHHKVKRRVAPHRTPPLAVNRLRERVLSADIVTEDGAIQQSELEGAV